MGLDVLALCLTSTGDYEQDAIVLAKQLLNPESQIDVGKGPPEPRAPGGSAPAEQAVTPGPRRHPGCDGAGAGVRVRPDTAP